MGGLVTLDSLLLGVLLALVSVVAWAGKRWMIRIETTLEEVKAQRVVCVQDFALKSDVNTAFKEIRKQGERISALESWREAQSGK